MKKIIKKERKKRVIFIDSIESMASGQEIKPDHTESIQEWESNHGHGFWGNATTGYIYDKDNR